MSKNESIKSNLIYNTLYQVLIMIVPLITTPYVSRTLGAEKIGQFSFSSAMVTYFIVFAVFGSTTFGQRNIAFYRDDKRELSDAFWSVFAFRMITCLIALCGYLVYLFFSDNWNLVSLLFSINIVNIVADITWLFQGLELFKKIVFRNLIIRILSTLAIFSFVKSQNDLWLYTIIINGSALLGNISLWTIVKDKIEKPRTIRPFKDIKGMFLIFLPTIATQIYTVLDKSMIGFITESNYANGCYEQAEKIARMALTIVTSIGVVVLPRIANLYFKNKIDLVRNYIYRSIRFTWMLALPIVFGLFSISSLLIPVFLGPGYSDAIILLKIFSFLVLFVSFSYVVGISYLIPTKQQNIYTVAVTVAAGVNVCMNLFLIPRFGAVGAAVSSVAAEFIGCSIQILYCINTRQFEFRKLVGPSWKYLISGSCMALLVKNIKLLVPQSFFGLIVVIMCASMTYFICLLVLKDDFLLDTINKLILHFFQSKKDRL